jgi:hypothetical protein
LGDQHKIDARKNLKLWWAHGHSPWTKLAPRSGLQLHSENAPILRMPFKEWTIPLGEMALLIRRRTTGGEVVSFAVVLVAVLHGEWHAVTRHDTAHGFAHREVLGLTEGLRGKLLCCTLSHKQAFQYAICDLKQNAEIYLADFLAH